MSKTSSSSSFAVTCNLLSQFIKEKGRSLGDLGLEIGKKGDTYRPPTTMSLLPGVDVSGEERKEEDVSDRNATSEPEKSQLTIFYGGKVLVFDSFPADKARDLMLLAGKGNTAAAKSTSFAPPSVPAVTAVGPINSSLQSSNFVSAPTNPPATVLNCPPRPLVSDLPIARKASLHRFLVKRKDRINAKAPYQVTEVKDSPASLVANPKEEDNQPWLGLKPCVSSERSR